MVMGEKYNLKKEKERTSTGARAKVLKLGDDLRTQAGHHTPTKGFAVFKYKAVQFYIIY